ncbi:MAG: glycoside hydrolase family 5 protein [Parasphingorhabdus sp.]|uniref:glycoside hydrolase family 5 protein n=1 Tax=Parasphingorhabdus sp. TaxID=2709688 RepID=UPI003296F43F
MNTRHLISALALLVSSNLAYAQTDSLPVGRCVNMGNHLEPPREGDWGRKIADDDFTIIARAGFDTIRLPVRWSAHAADKPPYTIKKSFMKRVKHLVKLARDAELNVILDDHHYEELYAQPEKHAPRLAGLWKQIAAAFADQPNDHLWFEIENEPHDKLNHDNLLATLRPALREIRTTNPDRPVIIGGELWSGINSLASLPLPNDPHIVPTFHYYDPFPFTHQGASWVDNPPPIGRKLGGKMDQEALKADVEKIRAYIARTGKTPFMGEFGAIDSIPVDERVHYQKTVREAFDAVGIGMCAWGYTNTFPLYDSRAKKWLPGMLEAMGVKGK